MRNVISSASLLGAAALLKEKKTSFEDHALDLSASRKKSQKVLLMFGNRTVGGCSRYWSSGIHNRATCLECWSYDGRVEFKVTVTRGQ